MQTTTNTKSVAVAYVLWFFLGGLGAHRFYMGRTGSGLGMLGLCVASTVLSAVMIGLLGFPILLIWWLADAFLINSWFKTEPPDLAAQLDPPMSDAA